MVKGNSLKSSIQRRWNMESSNAMLSHPSLVAQWLEYLHGKQKVLGLIPGLGKHFSPKHDCSLHQDQSFKSSWMIGEELTTKHTCLVLIDASMLSSALKITSLGWKTSTAPTFPQRGHWNSVLCSHLN